MVLFAIKKNPIEKELSAEQRIERLESFEIEELQQAILRKEQDNIESYVDVESKLNKVDTWLLKSNTIDLRLANDASFAAAKDILVMIYLYSKTNTCYDSIPYVWYDFLQPGETKNITRELKFDENLNKVECRIKDIKPAI